jgi:hypothetical protein
LLACEAATLTALRAGGGPAAAQRVLRAAATFFVLPTTCFMAHNAIRLVPHEYCPASSTKAACADVVFANLLLPAACSWALLSGLPARLAYGAELARGAAVTVVVFAVVWQDDAHVGAAWALRWVAKHVVLSAALPLLLRAALQAEEPPELAALQLCPRPLLPVRAALREARVLARALLAALLAHTVAKYGRQLLLHGSAQAGRGVLAAWAVLGQCSVARCCAPSRFTTGARHAGCCAATGACMACTCSWRSWTTTRTPCWPPQQTFWQRRCRTAAASRSLSGQPASPRLGRARPGRGCACYAVPRARRASTRVPHCWAPWPAAAPAPAACLLRSRTRTAAAASCSRARNGSSAARSSRAGRQCARWRLLAPAPCR